MIGRKKEAGTVRQALTRRNRDCGHLAAAMLSVVLLVCGCADKGTGPEPEPVRYLIYHAHVDSSVVYVYDADSLTLVDRIPVSGPAIALEVSPDGRWLYAQIGAPSPLWTLEKIDLRTKLPVAYLPGLFVDLTLLDGGRRLLRGWDFACLDEAVNDVVDPSGPRVVRTLADSLCRQKGPIAGTRVAAVMKGLPIRIRVTDIESGDVYGEYRPHLATGEALSYVRRVALHSDGRRVLAIAPQFGFVTWFLVGDVLTGETLLEHRMWKPQGQIAISDDGRWAITTDPGDESLESPPRVVDVYDLNAMAHVARFDGNDGVAGAGQIRFLPGTARVAAAKARGTLRAGPSPVAVIDLITMEVIWSVERPNGRVGGLAVGPRP